VPAGDGQGGGVDEDAPGLLVLLFAPAAVLYATARLVTGPSD
jgi:hypothetical protein